MFSPLKIVEASPDKNSDVFYGGLVSIGLFGIITEVTLQCQDTFNLHEVLAPRQSIEQCLSEMPVVTKRSAHVKYWIVIHSDTCSVFSANHTSEKPRDNDIRVIQDFAVCIYEFLLWMMSVFPSVTPYGMSVLLNSGLVFPPHTRVDHNSKVFNIPHRVGGHPEAEIGIDVKDCAEGIRTLVQMVKEENIPVNHIIEVIINLCIYTLILHLPINLLGLCDNDKTYISIALPKLISIIDIISIITMISIKYFNVSISTKFDEMVMRLQ